MSLSEPDPADIVIDADRRRKFLVVVDGSPESLVALKFASLRALHTDGNVALLVVIEHRDRQNWLGVDDIIREEARQAAENLLYRYAGEVNTFTGLIPELLIREGKKTEQVRRVVEEEPEISILVLGAGTEKEGPGPLVSLAAAGGDKAFAIPVTIVPGHLSDEEIKHLA